MSKCLCTQQSWPAFVTLHSAAHVTFTDTVCYPEFGGLEGQLGLANTPSCNGDYEAYLYDFPPRGVARPVNDGSINGKQAQADSCRGGRQPGKAVRGRGWYGGGHGGVAHRLFCGLLHLNSCACLACSYIPLMSIFALPEELYD